MQRGLEDGDAVILQHMEERGLSGIVETKEKELGMLVQQAERRENIVDCWISEKIGQVTCL